MVVGRGGLDMEATVHKDSDSMPRGLKFGLHGRMGGSARNLYDQARVTTMESEALRYISSRPKRRSAEAHENKKLDEGKGGIARWGAREFLLGHVLGQFVLLMFIAVCLVTFGAIAWLSCGRVKTADYNKSFKEALWFSWGVFFDPGTQTGLPADEFLAAKVVAVVFSIMGFIFNLVLLGLIVERVKDMLNFWVRNRGAKG